MIKELFPITPAATEGIDPNPKTDCVCCCCCRINDPDRNDTVEDEVDEGES